MPREYGSLPIQRLYSSRADPDDHPVLMDDVIDADRADATVVDGGVALRWRGELFDLHPLWLRERSTSSIAVDPVNGQRLVDPVDIASDVGIVRAQLTCGHDLEVTFSDGHEMTLPLSAIASDAAQRPPAAVGWSAANTEVPRINYRAIAGDDPAASRVARRLALSAFFELGFFVLEDTPPVAGALHEITSHFGRISPTNFGELFDVRTEPVAVDLAYTPVALSAHTDQPYRAPTPGLQFLHTITNDAPGGASTIVDGFAVIDELSSVDPEAHEVLCSLLVEFRYDIGTDVKVHRAPIIERNPDGSLRQLRFSPRLDFAPAAERRVLDLYYRGRRWLADALNDPSRQLEYRMKAGDTLVVDNHRVLHGRRTFDPTQGHRHLQGCYIDHDGPITEWILDGRESH